MNNDYYLDKFYNRLYDNTERSNKKITQKSILVSFLNLKSNTRHSLLKGSSILSSELPKETFEYFHENGLIRETDEVNEYVLTAKGIVEVEEKKGVFDPGVLIEYIDDKFFNAFKDSIKPLSDKEKVVLLSLVSARAFSDNSPMDLKKSEKVTETWKQITDKSYDLLSSLKLLKDLKKEDLYGKDAEKRTENPVSHVYRHTDQLPKKIKGLFKSLGSQKYYLDVSNEGVISKQSLAFIFSKIYGGNQLSYSEITDIYEYCSDVSLNQSIYLFDPSHKFSRAEHDELIREVLLFN